MFSRRELWNRMNIWNRKLYISHAYVNHVMQMEFLLFSLQNSISAFMQNIACNQLCIHFEFIEVQKKKIKFPVTVDLRPQIT